jgi:hypothetical protein
MESIPVIFFAHRQSQWLPLDSSRFISFRLLVSRAITIVLFLSSESPPPPLLSATTFTVVSHPSRSDAAAAAMAVVRLPALD